MSLSLPQGFTKSLVMTTVSEFGDRTFCVAAILAMRHPRRSVFFVCLFSVILMTVLSALVGWAAPNLISRKLADNITTLLFFVFGLWSLWDAYNEDDDDNDELGQVEKELDDSVASKSSAGKDKASHKGKDDLEKQKRAFSVTFLANGAIRVSLLQLGLLQMRTLGVILGGILGQAICTIAAVIGGKSLASQVSERLETLLGGVLFLLFGLRTAGEASSFCVYLSNTSSMISHPK